MFHVQDFILIKTMAFDHFFHTIKKGSKIDEKKRYIGLLKVKQSMKGEREKKWMIKVGRKNVKKF